MWNMKVATLQKKYMYITCVSGLWNFFLQWSLVNKLHRKTAFFRVTTLALTSKLVACNIDIIYELLRLTLYENLNSWIIHRYKWRKHPNAFLSYIWATKIIGGKNIHIRYCRLNTIKLHPGTYILTLNIFLFLYKFSYNL